MKVQVEGVWIQLTDEQIKIIEQARKKLETEANTFAKVLKHFGFKKINEPGCYSHPEYDWFAEIINRDHWPYVWMAGKGVKNSAMFPGGNCYYEPEQLKEELIRATLDMLKE